ncbi:Carboxylesterase type B, partial [Trinorchestia longiramus]
RLGSKFAAELELVFGMPFSDPGVLPAPQSRPYSRSPGPFGTSFSGSSPRQHPPRRDEGGYGGSMAGVAWVSPSNYTRNDALVSEIMMKLWSNFARAGSPNGQDGGRPNLSYPERSRFRNVTWEKYDSIYENYLEISSRPRVRDHYRAHKIALWNWLLPELQQTAAVFPDDDSRSWYQTDNPEYFIGPVRPLDPFRFLETTEASLTSPLPVLPSPRDEFLGPNVSAAHGSDPRHGNLTNKDPNLNRNPLLDYTTALTLTVAIGLSLLVLNVILFAALLYRRDRTQMGAKITYDSVSVQPLCTVDSGLRGGPSTTQESMTPPGKEVMVPCTADIQVTELRTFPTPPDIGDRNTEVTSYSSGSGGKRHGCSGLQTSQFVPPPPLLTTSTTSSHPTIESEIPSTLGSPVMVGSSGPPCTAGGTCPLPQQGSSFPPTSGGYCPPPPYCNEFPVSQYSPDPFTGSSCQQFSNPMTRSSIQQRTTSLNRNTNNSVCVLASRKPKPPPRDSSSSTPATAGSSSSTFATLPRQSSLDSSTHIIA